MHLKYFRLITVIKNSFDLHHIYNKNSCRLLESIFMESKNRIALGYTSKLFFYFAPTVPAPVSVCFIVKCPFNVKWSASGSRRRYLVGIVFCSNNLINVCFQMYGLGIYIGVYKIGQHSFSFDWWSSIPYILDGWWVFVERRICNGAYTYCCNTTKNIWSSTTLLLDNIKYLKDFFCFCTLHVCVCHLRSSINIFRVTKPVI